MFGGGLALAKAMEAAGVMKMIGEGISIMRQTTFSTYHVGCYGFDLFK